MRAAAFLSLLWAGAASAQLALDLPVNAEVTREVSAEAGARAIPTAPYVNGMVASKTAEGAVRITAYRVPGQPEPAALLAPLKAQLLAAGFRPLLDCETTSCGGFDFRFALSLIPPPDMFVDLGDFRYLSAVDAEGTGFVTILASRSQADGYLHIAQVSPSEAAALVATAPTPDAQALPSGDLSFADQLETQGHVVLEDLEFASGTTTLLEADYATLSALAAYLLGNPEREVALVGHTDASGALDINIEISRQRAASARARLIADYGVPEGQVRAEGMGYLAPRATNLTDEGRQMNRRVEVILTSTRP